MHITGVYRDCCEGRKGLHVYCRSIPQKFSNDSMKSRKITRMLSVKLSPYSRRKRLSAFFLYFGHILTKCAWINGFTQGSCILQDAVVFFQSQLVEMVNAVTLLQQATPSEVYAPLLPINSVRGAYLYHPRLLTLTLGKASNRRLSFMYKRQVRRAELGFRGRFIGFKRFKTC